MKKVLVFGTFDGVHRGHLDLFKQAKDYGDYLVVIVGRDSSVFGIKKRMPKYNEQYRLKMVKNCGIVNEALLGSENHNPYKDSFNLIKEVNPDIICLGYDQSEFVEKLEIELMAMGLNAAIKILKPFKPDLYKSSIVNKE